MMFYDRKLVDMKKSSSETKPAGSLVYDRDYPDTEIKASDTRQNIIFVVRFCLS